MLIHISPAYEGRLLRSYLKLTLGLSTAVLAKLKNREDGILVNGKRVTVRYVLHAGDILELADRDTAENASERVLPTDLPLSVLYEDDHVIALNKPPYMPTHPSHGHITDTLANALAFRYQSEKEPFVFRPLGRLDRNTSGVVIAGKTRAASGCLGRALKDGMVKKRYVAVLSGEMPVDGITHTLIAPIFRPDNAGIRRCVGDPEKDGAVYAETRYCVLGASEGHTLVLCTPVTGRTHQLRVHFSHLGYPILGDDIYAPDTVCEEVARHALHALSVSVPLPFFGAEDSGVSTLADLSVPLPLNRPSAEGILHTWAPLPPDLYALAAKYFPNSPVLNPMPSQDVLSVLPL